MRILSTPIEHHAVLDPLHWLALEGAEVELVPVDPLGRIDLAALRAAVEADPGSVALVSVMWANNEVGTVQPIAEIVEIAHAHGIPVHTDAVQALGQLPLDFAGSGVDAMTVTGHKVGGPYGVGALVVRRELQPTALLHGGGQERDIRSGTIDPPAIAGFAVACELAVQRQPELATRLDGLRALARRGRAARGARRHPQRRPGGRPHAPAARQRPPGVPRLRGRLAADAARRPRHRVLDRLGLRRRRPAGLARAAGDGLLGGVRPLLAAVLPGAHLDAGRRRRARGQRSPRWSSVPATPPCPRGPVPDGAPDARPRSDVGRRRLGGGRRPRGRAGPRRHRHPPRAVAQPEVLPHRRPRLLHDRGRQRRPAGGRRHRDPVLRLGPQRALPRGRRRGLPGGVRRGPHPQPLPALQREDQVRRRARPGARARLRRRRDRSLRPAAHR